MIHLIAAIARGGVIGSQGRLPWYLPADLQHFRALTMGHTVVMGRHTYESIGHALSGRHNVLVSRTLRQVADCAVAPTLAEALTLAAGTEIFIIGGAQLYAAALPLAQQLDLTWIEADYTGDTFFPSVCWSAFVEMDRTYHAGPPPYQFVTYRRRAIEEERA